MTVKGILAPHKGEKEACLEVNLSIGIQLKEQLLNCGLDTISCLPPGTCNEKYLWSPDLL